MQTRLADGRVYNYNRNIGQWSGAPGPCFTLPVGVTLDQEKNIYVLSRGHDTSLDPRAAVFTQDEEWLHDIGSSGKGDGQFVWSSGLAIDGEGDVYVSDEWLHRISIFDKRGTFLGKWDRRGSKDGQMEGPSGLAFDVDGNLYISDTQNNRIHKFTNDGKFLLSWGSPGTNPGQFNLPWGITVDSTGDVWAADWGNDRVQKFFLER